MATIYWEGDVSTDPTVAGNWSSAAVPQIGDIVYFTNLMASGPCAGGDVSANQVAAIYRESDFSYAIGTSAAAPLIFDCAGPVVDQGTGTAYWRIKNTTAWGFAGSGTCSIDGIDNDALNIDAPNAAVTVGPILATPAEFDTTITIHAGAVNLFNVTDQAAAATDMTCCGGNVHSHATPDTFRQTGGIWVQERSVPVTIYGNGGRIYLNGTGTVTALVGADGHVTNLSDAFIGVTFTNASVTRASFLDPHGRSTFTNPIQTPNCHSNECILDFGLNKKYTVAAI